MSVALSEHTWTGMLCVPQLRLFMVMFKFRRPCIIYNCKKIYEFRLAPCFKLCMVMFEELSMIFMWLIEPILQYYKF